LSVYLDTLSVPCNTKCRFIPGVFSHSTNSTDSPSLAGSQSVSKYTRQPISQAIVTHTSPEGSEKALNKT